MKNILIFTIFILFCACSTNTENTQPNASALYTYIDIYLKDSNNNDILGSLKYPESSIFANYLINSKVIQNNNNGNILDYPNNIMCYNELGRHCVRIFLNYAATEELPITYMHWNATEMDTLKAQYRRGTGIDGNYVVLQKLWYNDKLVWDVTVEGQTTSAITIVK